MTRQFFFPFPFFLFFTELTISAHSQPKAFLQSTILTPVPIHSIYHAVLGPWTLIINYRTLAATEKALAALTCDYSIMDTTRFVTTNFAGYYFNLSWKEKEKRNVRLLLMRIKTFKRPRSVLFFSIFLKINKIEIKRRKYSSVWTSNPVFD